MAHQKFSLIPDPHAYETACINCLEVAGYELTMSRVLVIRALALTNKPLKCREIYDNIRSRLDVIETINLVTVYRTTKLLEKIGVATFVESVGGYLPLSLDLICHSGNSIVILLESKGNCQVIPVPANVRKVFEAHLGACCVIKKVKVEIIYRTKP